VYAPKKLNTWCYQAELVKLPITKQGEQLQLLCRYRCNKYQQPLLHICKEDSGNLGMVAGSDERIGDWGYCYSYQQVSIPNLTHVEGHDDAIAVGAPVQRFFRHFRIPTWWEESDVGSICSGGELIQR